MIEALGVSGLATIQDGGRVGWRKFGAPACGAMDWFAMQAANALAGNDLDAPVIEIGLGEIIFQARSDCVIAVTGAGYEALNYVWTFPLWTSFYVRAGWNVGVRKTHGGNWAYLAIAGGFDAAPILGSRSTHLRGGMGRALQQGDALRIIRAPRDLNKLAARDFPKTFIPAYSQSPIIHVVAGPQSERFTEEGIQTFYNNEYSLSKSFDRMGYRLEGARIAHRAGADMISEGMTMGSIQVPANGQPIVMMADGPTTGGYPKIANVIRADMPLLAQCEAGAGKIRFKEISVDDAQARYRETRASIASSLPS